MLSVRALGRRPCWTLTRMIYAERGGPDLPEHTEIAPGALAEIAAAIESGRRAGPWLPIASGEEKALDLVVINRVVRGGLLPQHVGIVTMPGHLLHAEKETGVVHVAFRDGPTFRADPSLRFFVDGIFRHEALA